MVRTIDLRLISIRHHALCGDDENAIPIEIRSTVTDSQLVRDIILIKIRKSYKKFTLPFDKHNFQNKEMTDQQKELLNVKEKLIESAENSTKII